MSGTKDPGVEVSFLLIFDSVREVSDEVDCAFFFFVSTTFQFN